MAQHPSISTTEKKENKSIMNALFEKIMKSRSRTFKRAVRRIAVVTALLSAVAAPAGAQTSNLPILFWSRRADNLLRVFGMNPDGSNQTPIGFPESRGFFGRYSPNGEKIVFVRSLPDPNPKNPVGRRQHIFVMDADGTNQVDISQNDPMHHNNAPAWFPDGRIAFITFTLDFGPGADLWIMNADGNNRQLVYHSTGVGGAWYPWVSPDGTKIAFGDDSSGFSHIYVINPDGNNLRQLTNNRAQEYAPNWSPDGTKIVFTRGRPGTANGSIAGNGDIYVMDADGSHQIRLTNHANDDYYPIWSPDASQIVFTRGRGNGLNSNEINNDVYVMNADGSNVIQLTHTPPRENVATDWCCRSTE
jgi:Tol biopolymer transport system component